MKNKKIVGRPKVRARVTLLLDRPLKQAISS